MKTLPCIKAGSAAFGLNVNAFSHIQKPFFNFCNTFWHFCLIFFISMCNTDAYIHSWVKCLKCGRARTENDLETTSVSHHIAIRILLLSVLLASNILLYAIKSPALNNPVVFQNGASCTLYFAVSFVFQHFIVVPSVCLLIHFKLLYRRHAL